MRWHEADFSLIGVRAALPGLGINTLQAWIREGLVEPTGARAGTGRPRHWSPLDISQVVTLRKLRQLGVPPKVATGVGQIVRRRAEALAENDDLAKTDGGLLVYLVPCDDGTLEAVTATVAEVVSLGGVQNLDLPSTMVCLNVDRLLQEMAALLGKWHRLEEDRAKKKRPEAPKLTVRELRAE